MAPPFRIVADPDDEAWVARQAARSSPAVRTAVLCELAARPFREERRPAVRGDVDDAWVRSQLEKRERYIRDRLAPLMGIDPDEAVAAARMHAWPDLARRRGVGSLAI